MEERHHAQLVEGVVSACAHPVGRWDYRRSPNSNEQAPSGNLLQRVSPPDHT